MYNCTPYLFTYLLIYLLTYLRTHSMEQLPSEEAYRFSASQGIPCIFRNPNVHYRFHKCPPPVRTKIVHLTIADVSCDICSTQLTL